MSHDDFDIPCSNPDHDLAMAIIKAVAKSDWEFLLSVLPDGVVHRSERYNKEEQFYIEGDYEEDARYIYPARENMLNQCAHKAYTLLNNLYG